jgi:hypothetical protein
VGLGSEQWVYCRSWSWVYTGWWKNSNCISTEKNDLTWCVTHRDAVFQMVIHSIFDAWHYDVLWTYTLTTLLWYACDFVCWIVYIMLHTTYMKASCQMKFIACSQVYSEVYSEVHSQLLSMAHFQLAWLMLSCKLSRYSQVHSQPAWLYATKQALKTFPNTLWVHSQVHLHVCSQLHSWACIPGHFQVHSMAHSQSALLYDPNQALKTLSSTVPFALDGTFPAYLALCSQVYSQQDRHSQSHLTILSHICSCMLDLETCWVAHISHQES